MANNRIYLAHKPSKMAVFLGKRLAGRWYDVPDNLSERVNALFQHVFDNSEFLFEQDDFALIVEDNEFAKDCLEGQASPNQTSGSTNALLLEMEWNDQVEQPSSVSGGHFR